MKFIVYVRVGLYVCALSDAVRARAWYTILRRYRPKALEPSGEYEGTAVGTSKPAPSATAQKGKPAAADEMTGFLGALAGWLGLSEDTTGEGDGGKEILTATGTRLTEITLSPGCAHCMHAYVNMYTPLRSLRAHG